MKKYSLLYVLLCLLSCYSCSKNTSEKPASATPLVTAPGTPDGTAVSKAMNGTGGSITSADGRIKIDVPAGALPAAETITIQPITNQMGSGVGHAYRITPHNITFQKPVTISFTYTNDEIKGTLPAFLGIAYHQANGGWLSVGGAQVDTINKKITVTSTHFSDWGFFTSLYLKPIDARVQTNETLEISVLGTVAVQEDVRIKDQFLMEPFIIYANHIRKWNYSGEGNLQVNGLNATYTAPSKVPARNPEAISVEIKMEKPGTFLLVTNIKVVSAFHIDYLQVDETEMNLPGYTYPSRLHIYGNFGNDPGTDKRSVKIGSSSLNVVSWTPKLILCDIQTSGPASSGKVMVTSGTSTDSKILNEWTVDLLYDKVESPGGTLTRKVKIVLTLRGDADGFYAADQTPLFPYTDLNIRSAGIITMPVGSYSNIVHGDGCGTYTAKWDAIGPDYLVGRQKYGAVGKGLGAQIINTPEGFKIKIRFRSPDILTSTRTYVPCVGSTAVNKVTEYITIGGFEEKEIMLKFSNRGAGASIMADSLRINRTGVASGLLFDAEDVNPDLYYTTLKWAVTKSKFE
jgi:hypothetical protein